MGLFDGLLAKLRYTGDAVNDIGEAANEKGAGIDLLATPLSKWPEFIRRNIRVPGAGMTGVVYVDTGFKKADPIHDIPVEFPASITGVTIVKEGEQIDTVDVSGTWEFNDTLTNPSGLFVGSGKTSFTSNGNNFIGFTHAYLSSDTEHEEATMFGYAVSEDSVTDVYVWSDPSNPLASTGWVNSAYKTITFTSDFPTMDAALYEWFAANATKIS